MYSLEIDEVAQGLPGTSTMWHGWNCPSWTNVTRRLVKPKG